MKRIITVFMVLILAVLSLSARPQFYFGTGAGAGRLYSSEKLKNTLSSNERYGIGVYYLSYVIPSAQFTYIPYADFPLGVTVSGGYGFVTAENNGKSSYASSRQDSSDNFRYGADDIFSLSLGLTYSYLADSSRYFSFTFSALYDWNRYSLNTECLEKGKRVKNKEKMTLDVHSVSFDLGIMGRYDESYFKIDCSIAKTLNSERGILTLFDGDGYSVTLYATVGIVFTFLSSNEFMR